MAPTFAETLAQMGRVFAGMFAALLCAYLSCPAHSESGQTPRWLASRTARPAVHHTERWFLRYGVVWIAAFAATVGFRLHEAWHAPGLFLFMFTLALPLLLQPFLFPGMTGEAGVPLLDRFSLKATVWIAVFSFIGNWWYTHYFYSVLGAHYTMTSWDANGVPIPMYFATHFYFCFYHVLGNCVLRRIATSLPATPQRLCFSVLAVLCAAYTTAFMETLTILRTRYKFDDFHRSATIGSAFYGIYFIVSFPMFYRLSGGTSADDDGGRKTKEAKGADGEGRQGEFGQVTLFQATVSASPPA